MSMVVAGLLILVQRNLKRLMAYSSIEHMGIIAIGLGLGGPLGLFGALLHTFNHSVAKSLLFFSAGNVRQNVGTLRIDGIHGISRTMPQTCAALLVGGLAIVGLPPFSLFISEFAILSEAFTQARYFVVVLFLIVLSVVFGGFAYPSLQHARRRAGSARREFKADPVRIHCNGDRRSLPCYSSGHGFPTSSASSCGKPWRCCDDGKQAIARSRWREGIFESDAHDSSDQRGSAGTSCHDFRKPRSEPREASSLHF